jgi:serpin B
MSANSKNLTAGLASESGSEASDSTEAEISDEFRLAHSQFALELMKRQFSDDKNVMISPYSVMQALGMLTNGADKNTLKELEDLMGGLSIEDLNKELQIWRKVQPNEEDCKLSTANSIWAVDNEEMIKVRPEFLQTTADYYNSEFFLAPFDSTTLNDINSWINDKTDNMIPEVLKEIPPDAVMYLINAVAFDAKWETPYKHDSARPYDFTCYNGDVQTAEMLCSAESLIIKDDHATGFYKYYKGRKYAFAALLPEEGMTVTEYIDSLTPEHFSKLFAEPDAKKVSFDDMYSVMLPKFKYKYKTNLNTTLQDMGMKDSFDPSKADFSKLDAAKDSPYVSNVYHDTFIQLDEDGTKAAAATVIEMTKNGIAMPPENKLYFDRPFVYAIVDTETDMPVFMGTLTSIPE